MGVDPTVVVAALPSSPKGRKKLLLVLGVIALAAIFIAVYYLRPATKATPTPTPAPQTNTQANVFQKRDIKAELNQTIKTNFGGTKYFQDIDGLVRLADKSTSSEEAYQSYLRAFKKVGEAYKETKSPNYRAVLVQMKDFLKVFPSYKEADVVIPK